MPNAWVEPEVFMEHSGVTIYHTYNNDDINNKMAYHYTVDISEQSHFDIRNIPEYDCGLPHKEVFRRAIDNKSAVLMEQLAALENGSEE